MSDEHTIINKMQDLVNELNHYTKLYDEGHPNISDKEWDDKYFELLLLEQQTGIVCTDSPTQRIDYQVVSELKKVKHNHLILSLDKTKDWDTFLNYFKGKDAVCMQKLDGLTCSLRYLGGRLVSAETRGNGEIGEDILHNALAVTNIPKRINFTDELIVDGEVVCTYKDFEKFKDQYANPRNFASGSIRLLDSEECGRRCLTFVAWNVVNHPWGNSFTSNLVDLHSLGFTTIYTTPLTEDVLNFFKENKLGNYPIDGLVARFDDIAYGESLGSTGHHSRAAYAFKFYDEEYETWLKNIEWTMGRTGQLTPVAVFEPIDTGDSIIERASLHNISIMKQLLGTPYSGQTLHIFKANDIIPQVASAGIPECKADIEGLTFKIPTECPICGGRLEVVCEVDTKVLMCTNEACEGKLCNRLDHFASKKGLDIKGLSKATLEKLIDWGWVNSITDIYNLKAKRNEWINKPGFGQKSVDNILEAIENSRNPKLESFISAIGIPHIGKTLSKEIAKYFDDFKQFMTAAKEHWDFTQIEGIAYEKAYEIWKFNYDEAEQVDFFMLGYETDKPAAADNLTGENICITGRLNKFSNREEFVKAVQDHGGKVTSSVSKNTSWLVTNTPNSGSTKNAAAQRLGIPIITEEEFINLYLS